MQIYISRRKFLQKRILNNSIRWHMIQFNMGEIFKWTLHQRTYTNARWAREVPLYVSSPLKAQRRLCMPIKSLKISRVGVVMRQPKLAFIACEYVKQYNHLGKQLENFLQSQIYPYHVTRLFYCQYFLQGKNSLYSKTYTVKFTAVSPITAPNRKQLKCHWKTIW